MKYIANIEIGGFKKGEEVPQEKAEIWNKMYKNPPIDVIEGEKEEEPSRISIESEKKLKERLKDIEEDLRDDGKLNYSHDPKRKSPGRKRKK